MFLLLLNGKALSFQGSCQAYFLIYFLLTVKEKYFLPTEPNIIEFIEWISATRDLDYTHNTAQNKISNFFRRYPVRLG
jgi:hypothetical protein